MSMQVKTASLDDVFEIHDFIGKMEGLVQHPVHFYNIMIRYFGNTFFIIREEEQVAGFVWGFVSQTDPDILFLWQIGVSKEFRGKNISKMLIDAFKKAAREKRCKKIHATVEPSNIASWKMFEKFGFSDIAYGKTTVENQKKAMLNYYGSGTNQILYEYIV